MHGQGINRSFKLGDIIRKHIQQQELDKEEQRLLTAWLAEDPENRKLFDSLGDQQSLANAIRRMRQSDTAIQWDMVNRRIIRQRAIKRIRRWAPAAAAVLLFFTTGLWYFIDSKTVPEPPVSPLATVEDVAPGTNRATLTLDGGESIVLSEEKEGISITDESIHYDDGTSITKTGKIVYATISTPRAGQYHITLADGSRVWLNAQTSLRYPTRFESDSREVYIDGEAFFEVAHLNGKPFTVHTPLQDVIVMGTSFNVYAYKQDSSQVTTLATGKVRIEGTGDHKNTVHSILSPGQQAVFENGKMNVRQVDVNGYTSWKDGYYILDSYDIHQFAKQMERWYDVDFEISSDKHIKISGVLSRNLNLSEVLSSISQNQNIKFEVNGRRIKVL
ncbi:FecR domain-containing protein [Flavobacterium dauae]|uniref:FecR family protein n=1 Tax=Flavobacterium dauae TaxID=1563479 RepID=UPI00101CA565|nr:FecR family protein [Flavobacterium dauae]WLD24338.1 FecR domain-containing protein [Flavobacterium dauae]